MRTTWAMIMAFTGLFASAANGSDEKPKEQEKGAAGLAANYAYPDSDRLGSPFDGPGIIAAKYTTADAPGKVAQWYRKKLGWKAGVEGVMINPANQPGVRIGVVNDSRQPGNKDAQTGEPRPAPVMLLVQKTDEIVATVAISRAEGEKVTHIALVVVDNRDK